MQALRFLEYIGKAWKDSSLGGSPEVGVESSTLMTRTGAPKPIPSNLGTGSQLGRSKSSLPRPIDLSQSQIWKFVWISQVGSKPAPRTPSSDSSPGHLSGRALSSP